MRVWGKRKENELIQQQGSDPVPLAHSFIKDRSKAGGLPMKSKKASSFHEFARSTSDAWDIGDDEDEDFSSSSSSSSLQTLNSKVAKATAAQVLENHSKLRVKPERCQPALGDLPTNCKVIKSSSEAQLSRTSGKSHLQEQPPAPVLSYLATELNCLLLLPVWAQGCDTACKHNRGFFFLLISCTPRSHFQRPGFNACVLSCSISCIEACLYQSIP